MATANRGDVLIRVLGGSSLELVDAVTREPITMASSINEAIAVAAERRAAVWRENVDEGGRAIGAPILLLPRVSV